MAFLKKGVDVKKELQTEVKTNEDWEKILQTEGLVVVDAYAGWCGPCKAIINILRKIKNESGDDLLNYAVAQTDNIDLLEKYRGRSEPTFLFYGGGQLVNVIRGCNGPLINKSILEFLNKEHQIIEGNAERVVFIDKFVIGDEDEKEDPKKIEEDEEVVNKSRSSSVEEVQVQKNFAVALIKPDAVQAGLVDQIIEEIKANGLEILRQEERTLTKEEAADFYKQHEGSDHFEQLIEFMSSGPCMTLVVSRPGDDVGDDLLPEFRKLIGPLDVNMAKEEAPESLRAKYGTDSIQNAVHSCDSNESAARELAFFYPDFNVPVVERKQIKKRLQRTLALIRPNALKKRKDSILKTIEDSGFLIAMQKEVQLEREQVEELYAEHKDKDYFESLVTNMTCGPSLALCLAREDAVQVWRDMLGPKDIQKPKPKGQEEEAESNPDVPEQTESESPVKVESKLSLRVRFSDPEDSINPLHGADTEEQVQREMNMFFPMETTVAVIKPDVYEKENERDLIFEKIKEAGFKISAHKEVKLTKELASMFYKEHEGKEFFDNLTEYMSSGPSQFLILSREDAVSGFRSLLGPTAPEEAKEVNPNSLRAQFGLDPMKNAVHGSSSVSKAINVINEFFPDVALDKHGLVVAEAPEKGKKEVEVNANEPKEAPNGDVKTEETTEETPKETNGDAVKETSEEPAESGETEAKPEEGTTTEDAATEETKKEEPTAAAPEDVKITEESAKEEEAQPTTEEDKKENETPKEGEVPSEDAEKKGGEVEKPTEDSPTETVAAPGETAAHPAETATPPAETAAPPAETAALPAETAALLTETAAPPAETAAPPTETEAAAEAPSAEAKAPAAEAELPADSEAPTTEQTATSKAETDETTETETSREPTITTADETSREPTIVESTAKTDETTTETEISREPTIEQSTTEDSKTDSDATAS